MSGQASFGKRNGTESSVLEERTGEEHRIDRLLSGGGGRYSALQFAPDWGGAGGRPDELVVPGSEQRSPS